MPISFAGVSLLHEDPEGAVAAHVQRYLEWPRSQINAPARMIDSKSRIQRPEWPAMPALRPNQLYMPTGATRWGQFIGLATKGQKDAILSAVGTITAKGTLRLSVLNGFPVTVEADIPRIDGATFNLQQELAVPMWLLPPVPVSQTDDSLWIIPLVDDRYWWQQQMFISSATTWADLKTEIETSLGLSTPIMRDTVSDVNRLYGIPDGCYFRNGAINTAAALDLMCWATNQRLVMVSAGTLTQTSPTQWVMRSVTPNDLYQLERSAQLDFGWTGQSAAGGEFSKTDNGDVPRTINFKFTNDGKTSKLSYSASTPPAWAAGQNLDVLCPATSTGANDTELKAMADRWASEFWEWSKWRFAWCWNWILDWHFTGYEDYCLYDVARGPRGRSIARTFVKSLPPLGWGADFVPLQFSDGGNQCCGSGLIFGRATSAIAGAASPLSPTAFTFREFCLTDDATVTPHTQKEADVDTPGVNEWPDGYGVDSIVCVSSTKGECHLVWAREVCGT